MNIKARRIIFSSFLFLFLIIAPIIIAYSFGIRFDFNKKHIVQAGVITVDSIPHSATIRLNGEVQKQKTPAKFTRLAPGQYTLKVSKLGYYDWQSETAVQKGEASIFDNVYLIKNTESQLLVAGTITSIEQLTDGGFLIIQKSSENVYALSRFTFGRSFENVTSQESISPPQMFCATDSQQCIMSYETALGQSLLLINLSGQFTTSNFSNNHGEPITHIAYSSQAKAWIGLRGNAIVQLDFIKQLILPYVTSSDPVQDYLLQNDEVVVLTEQSIFVRSTKNLGMDMYQIKLNHKYKLLKSSNGNIFLLNGNGNAIGIYRVGNQSVSEIDIRGSDALYAERARAFVIANTNEIWLMDNNLASAPRLIWRSSGTLTKSSVNSHAPYLMHLHNNVLTFLELLRKNPYSLALSSSPVYDFAFANNGKTLLFVTDEGLFTQEIF